MTHPFHDIARQAIEAASSRFEHKWQYADVNVPSWFFDQLEREGMCLVQNLGDGKGVGMVRIVGDFGTIVYRKPDDTGLEVLLDGIRRGDGLMTAHQRLTMAALRMKHGVEA